MFRYVDSLPIYSQINVLAMSEDRSSRILARSNVSSVPEADVAKIEFP